MLKGNASECQVIRASVKRPETKVHCAMHSSLFATDSKTTVQGWTQHGEIRHTNVELRLEEAKVVWVFGFGARHTFLDRMQLLRCVDQSKFVNRVDSLVFAHGKHTLVQPPLTHFHPTTVVSDDTDLLLAHLETGGDWVLKPVAGSFGRSVFHCNFKRLRPGATAGRYTQ